RGIGVAIDDFGTGHSSLARLRDLPVDTVKLDRSFIAPLPGQAARALVDAFLRLARGLSLQTVAEGVETTEQRDQLTNAGCDDGQRGQRDEPTGPPGQPAPRSPPGQAGWFGRPGADRWSSAGGSGNVPPRPVTPAACVRGALLRGSSGTGPRRGWTVVWRR